MKKVKNEAALVKKAIEVGERLASNLGYNKFSATDSANQKIESLYRFLVHHKMVQPLATDQEDLLNMKHKLALWIAKKLPADHALVKEQ